MRWYRNLYLGDNAKKAKYKVFGRIRKGRFTSDTFLITLPSSEENLLDITSANFLLQPYFKKKINLDKICCGACKRKRRGFISCKRYN